MERSNIEFRERKRRGKKARHGVTVSRHSSAYVTQSQKQKEILSAVIIRFEGFRRDFTHGS